MQITPEIASDMMDGKTVYHVTGWRIGIRPVRRIWFNLVSGHFVADVGSCFMWSDGRLGPWHSVPASSPCERR